MSISGTWSVGSTMSISKTAASRDTIRQNLPQKVLNLPWCFQLPDQHFQGIKARLHDCTFVLLLFHLSCKLVSRLHCVQTGLCITLAVSIISKYMARTNALDQGDVSWVYQFLQHLYSPLLGSLTNKLVYEHIPITIDTIVRCRTSWYGRDPWVNPNTGIVTWSNRFLQSLSE